MQSKATEDMSPPEVEQQRREKEQKCINDWIEIASRSPPPCRELASEEKYVFQPVILYPLSPLQARAILEITGIIRSRGCDISTILKTIAGLTVYPPHDKSGADAASSNEPLRSERVGESGYVEISVPIEGPPAGYPTRYIDKHVWMWEKEHGPVPEGHTVSFRDGGYHQQ